jgi:hypothetical protein
MKQTIIGLILLLLINQVQAGAVEVVRAVADCVNNLCDFGVTLRHVDAGSDHYADRWEILSMNGDVLATRTLLHPHVNEQPFTRYLYQVRLPADMREVRVRAHDSRHGYGSSELVVRLRADEN